jgi:hypothetical protein
MLIENGIELEPSVHSCIHVQYVLLHLEWCTTAMSNSARLSSANAPATDIRDAGLAA